MEFTIEELEKIISNGDFDSLIGKIENDFFDCKSQIYDLKNENSKRELAKDVSSFANSAGGYILIGPKTNKSEIHFGDEIVGMALLNQDLIDPNQYIDIIKAWVYPHEIQGLRVYWQLSKDDSDKGIIVIKIPPQKELSKPFLITKFVEGREKTSEIIFGYAERRGDRGDSRKIEDIHKIMRDGLSYDKNIENRFSNIESIVQASSKKRVEEEQQNKDKDIIDKRVSEILKLYDDNSK